MNSKELIELEDRLVLQFPDYYRSFLLNYPEELHALGAPYEPVSGLYILSAAKDIEKLNKQFPELHNKIAIGEDGGGSYYFISRNEDDPVIYWLDGEDLVMDPSTGKMDAPASIRPAYDNLEAYIAELKQMLEEG